MAFGIYRSKKDPETGLNVNKFQAELMTEITDHVIANNLGDTSDPLDGLKEIHPNHILDGRSYQWIFVYTDEKGLNKQHHIRHATTEFELSRDRTNRETGSKITLRGWELEANIVAFVNAEGRGLTPLGKKYGRMVLL